MTLEAQIQLMTVPQEFCRLCNAVLHATHGNDFLAIDDDQPDAGNDGYLKPERRMFAMHCFKRVQNQSLEQSIRRKMVGDLGKAIALKTAGLWEIESWTFVSNYPITDAVARDVVAAGLDAGVDVSWMGPAELALALQEQPAVRERFPALQVHAVAQKLDAINERVDVIADGLSPGESFAGVPKTPEQESLLIAAFPDFWEYRLFAGVLYQGREDLEFKYLDHAMGIVAQRTELDFHDANSVLGDAFRRVGGTIETIEQVFGPAAQERAFGAPGEPGDVPAIRHLAIRVLSVYEELLDSAAQIRLVDPPDLLRRTFGIAARYMDAPIDQFRNFMTKAVTEAERLPERAADVVEPRTITLDLVLDIDAATQHELDAEMKRVGRKVRWLGWLGGDLNARAG